METVHERLVSDEARRRVRPKLWNLDWLILKAMRRQLIDAMQKYDFTAGIALDFGCGEQPYRDLLERAGVSYLPADLDAKPPVALIKPDGIVEIPDGFATSVLSFQVLEHVRNVDLYLEEAKRILSPGGALLLSTHGTWLYHPHPEDHRRWTRPGLIGEIEKHGFDVELCAPLVGPLAWTTMIRMTCLTSAIRRFPLIGPALVPAVIMLLNLKAAIEDRITPSRLKNDNACVYMILARLNP